MASEKIISVVSSELTISKGGKQYLSVVDQDKVRFSCWDEKFWNSLGKNASAKIEFEQKGIFKNIVAVEPMKEAIGKIPPQPEEEPAPQAIGMCWKEIGQLILADKLGFLFGTENAKEITRQYRGYLLSTLELPFDGAKLPQWDKPKES